jgi:hypothetical protein
MVTGLLALSLTAAATPGRDNPPPGKAASAADGPFHARLLEVARSYAPFGRVDDEARWAPYLCRLPNPAQARFSASKESDTHGLKLYSLFAKDRFAYVRLADKAQPVGQVMVKESWLPQEVKDEGQAVRPTSRPVKGGLHRDTFLPYARRDGRLYHAARQADLFIMFKTDPATPGTDQGWVYGTVTADAKKVTSAGRVESCMKCHQKAPHDRLFGLPKS